MNKFADSCVERNYRLLFADSAWEGAFLALGYPLANAQTYSIGR